MAILRNKLNSALYVANTQQSGQNQRTLTFEYSDGQITVRKAVTFDLTPTQPKKQPSPNLYVVKLETSVTQNNAPVQAFPSWPAGFGDQTVPPSYANSLAIYRYQDTTDRKQQKSISSGATITTPMQWAGVADQYFAAVFLPDDPQNAAMVQLRNQIAIPKNLDKPDPNQTVNVDVIGAAVGSKNGATTERLFVGPKALEVLDVIHSTPIAGQARKCASSRPRSDPPATSPKTTATAAGASSPSTSGSSGISRASRRPRRIASVTSSSRMRCSPELAA